MIIHLSNSQPIKFKDMSHVGQDEIDRMILEGDQEGLENVFLSGKGASLKSKSSWNEDMRLYLKKIPGKMVRSFHILPKLFSSGR